MDRPADPTIAVSVGNSATNDDGGPTSKDPNESPIAGKKRSPSNSISKGSGRAKKRSPLKNCVENGEYYVGEETNMANSEDVVDSFESETSDDVVVNENNEVLVPSISSDKDDQEEEEIADPELSDDSNKSNENEILQLEESPGDGNEDNDGSNGWSEFVAEVERDTYPNMNAYIKVKNNRIEATNRFVDAAEACFQALQDTSNTMSSDIVEPICARFWNDSDKKEKFIIKTMFSNHSRRNELLKLMQNADDAWNRTYNKLSTEIMGQNGDSEGGDLDGGLLDGEGSGNPVGANDGQLLSQNVSEEMTPDSNSSEEINEETDADPEGSNWDKLYEYEPSRERIQSFVEEREKRDHIKRAFKESFNDIESGLFSEIEASFEMINDIYDHTDKHCLKSEEEIEAVIMNNYDRKVDLQREIERSAQQAQNLFATLFSRLNQSAPKT